MFYNISDGLFKTVVCLLVAGFLYSPACGTEDDVIETGKVNWSSDLEVAKRTSMKTGKPLFLLFQEIPG